jgi:hypothetical protein
MIGRGAVNGLPSATFRGRFSDVIKRQQATERFIVRKIDRPAVGGGNGFIQGAVQSIEPRPFERAALIIECCQRALAQRCLSVGILWHYPIRKARHNLGHAQD